jgi:LCP family protein required for cell wall assembly
MKRLLGFPAAGIVAALLWTSVGSVHGASSQEKPARIARAHEGSRTPSFEEPIFLLLLGGDALRGNPERVRMDSIHILGIDPVSRRATLIGIPRDSFVEIPGRGSGKITSAGSAGGPELMIRTVERLSGCRFDYYMLTSFQGFVRLVNEFGGINFDVPYRLFEKKRSRVDLSAGPQLLLGREALGWARNRYDARRPRGDFDRSFAQGQLIIAALAEARADYAESAGTALRALGALRRNLRMNIPLDEALRLGLMALRIPPENVTNIVVDGAAASNGGASIVKISQTGRNQLADACADALPGQ